MTGQRTPANTRIVLVHGIVVMTVREPPGLHRALIAVAPVHHRGRGHQAAISAHLTPSLVLGLDGRPVLCFPTGRGTRESVDGGVRRTVSVRSRLVRVLALSRLLSLVLVRRLLGTTNL